MVDASEVRCMPVGATTVMVAGETPNNLNNDKLGEFIRRLGKEVNGRPIYSQVGNDNPNPTPNPNPYPYPNPNANPSTNPNHGQGGQR